MKRDDAGGRWLRWDRPITTNRMINQIPEQEEERGKSLSVTPVIRLTSS
jgi:hypothetical protein